MQGEIAITEELVKYNDIGYSVFNLFGMELKRFTKSFLAGWYAYKFEKGIHYFKWRDENSKLSSDKYMIALKKDGYQLGFTSEVIENAFK